MEIYGIKLSYNNGAEGFVIPVNPESIQVRNEGQGKTYNIVGKGGGTEETRAGEINVIKSPKLKEITFSSFFPAPTGTDLPYVVAPLREPMLYVKDILKWMESKRPIRFVFVGGFWNFLQQSKQKEEYDINIPASIESFEWKEVAGSPGDLEYTLKLKEYVFYAARIITETKDSQGNTILVQGPPHRPDERIRPETYILQKGDNLIKVAMKFYDGDSSRHKDIQKLNNLSDAQTRKLQIGMEIKLPQI